MGHMHVASNEAAAEPPARKASLQRRTRGSAAPVLFGCAFLLGLGFAGCNRETTAAAEPARVQQAGQQATGEHQARGAGEARSNGDDPAKAEHIGGSEEKAAPGASAAEQGGDLFDAREMTDSVKEDSFALSIKASGSYTAGKKGEATIELLSLGPYKVNDKYPYKFKIKQSDGLKLDNKVIAKDSVKLEKTRAVMLVPFTPESAGKKTLAGQFAFSVCTDDRCLIEKRDLKLAFDVAAP